MAPAVLLLLWWVLADGRWDSLGVGLPTVLTASAVAWGLGRDRDRPRVRLSPLGTAQFVLSFLARSLVGGIDIARRALHPRLAGGDVIDPGLLELTLRLPAGPERVVFVGVVNLLPGTVSADLRDDLLVVHAIDHTPATERDLRRLEQRVAAMFGRTGSAP
jgi:multicomponent Na+:H+ antiporter subunit E